MSLRALWRRLVYFVRRDRMTAELEEEMRLHVDLRAGRIEEAGFSPVQAKKIARQQFGDADVHVERSRGQWGARRLDILVQDVRYALRAMVKDARLSFAVIALLGLGLGANAVVFSVADALLIRAPAGVAAPQHIKRVYFETHTYINDSHDILDKFTYPEYMELVASSPAWQFAAYSPADENRERGYSEGTHENAPRVSFATTRYFDVLGLEPAVGRFYSFDENVMSRPASVAVLSYAFWQRRFGGDRSILGRTVMLSHLKVVVIGIAPRGFTGIDVAPTDAWVPIAARPAESTRHGVPWYQEWQDFGAFRVIARVPDNAQTRVFSARATTTLRDTHIRNNWGDSSSTFRIMTGPILQSAGPSLSPVNEARITRALALCAVLVILVAATNVMNLLLARSVKRRRDIAIRAALGMPASRLIGQLVTETLVLSMVAAAVAIVIAMSLGGIMRNLLLPAVAWDSGPVNFRVAVFTFAAATVVGCLSALPISLHATRPQLNTLLSQGERAGSTRGTRSRTLMLTAQTAIAVVLLICGGLFAHSLVRLWSVDIGYDKQLLIGQPEFWNPEQSHYENGEETYWDKLGPGIERAADALRNRPGVVAVTPATYTPMRTFRILRMSLFDANGDSRLSRIGPTPIGIDAGPDYFSTVGIQLIRGRSFLKEETWRSRVLIVSESAARHYWPGQDPIGRCLILRVRTDPCNVVVGLVSDVHTLKIVADPAVAVYTPLGRNAREIIVRAEPGHERMVQAMMKQELQKQFPQAERAYVQQLTSITAPEIQPWRVGASLFSSFALLALIIAALGVYSVVAYNVSAQLRELGIRMVLGATARDVLYLIFATGMRGVYVGTAAGLMIVVAAGRILAPVLFQTSPHDPVVLGAAALVMLSCAVAACLRPALRAINLDPATVIRTD